MKGKVFIAADHGGFELKQFLIFKLVEEGYVVEDLGTNSLERVDYPDYATKMAKKMKDDKTSRGILICGTGIGMSIAANRYPHVRAALVHDAFAARLSREHNNANIIALGGRVLGNELALDCVRVFLSTEFDGGRHQARIDKIGSDC